MYVTVSWEEMQEIAKRHKPPEPKKGRYLHWSGESSRAFFAQTFATSSTATRACADAIHKENAHKIPSGTLSTSSAGGGGQDAFKEHKRRTMRGLRLLNPTTVTTLS